MRLRLYSVLFASFAASAQIQPKEVALGAYLAREIEQRTTALGSDAIREYTERIGRGLAAGSPDAGFNYKFSGVADDLGDRIHEPRWLPAGYIFVPASLFLAAQNESEFAGMLAHAMAHSAARHGIFQAAPGSTVNYGSIPLIFMDAAGSDEHTTPVGLRSIRRKFEIDGDLLVIKTMAAAGYDPEALVRYIRRVQLDQSDEAQVPHEFSTLPPRDIRIRVMEKAIEELPPKSYRSSDEFSRI